MKHLTIAILLFDRYTALDVVGPYEVLARIPGATVMFVGPRKGLYNDSYGLKMEAEFALDEVQHADILLVPGGWGIDDLLKDNAVLSWIKKIDSTSTWTLSVCSGALVLAEAGVLNEKKSTTHWKRIDQLKDYGLTVLNERVVHDGKVITSAGVSAGIDMALYLAGQILGEETAKQIQVAIEYDPKPPFDFEEKYKMPGQVFANPVIPLKSYLKKKS
jgi:transcriptional regulator GlxA family with amidase domain